MENNKFWRFTHKLNETCGDVLEEMLKCFETSPGNLIGVLENYKEELRHAQSITVPLFLPLCMHEGHEEGKEWFLANFDFRADVNRSLLFVVADLLGVNVDQIPSDWLSTLSIFNHIIHDLDLTKSWVERMDPETINTELRENGPFPNMSLEVFDYLRISGRVHRSTLLMLPCLSKALLNTIKMLMSMVPFSKDDVLQIVHGPDFVHPYLLDILITRMAEDEDAKRVVLQDIYDFLVSDATEGKKLAIYYVSFRLGKTYEDIYEDVCDAFSYPSLEQQAGEYENFCCDFQARKFLALRP